MYKIAITGSLASGKSSAAKFIKGKKYLVFSADKCVDKIYKKKNIRLLIKKKLRLKNTKNIKKKIKLLLLKKKIFISNLEKIIHPEVKKERKKFIKKNKNKKTLFFEIPLLFESKISKEFDKVFFIHAKRHIRLRRFVKRGGQKKFFTILDRRQTSPRVKIRKSDEIIYNNKSLNHLKNNVFGVLKKYE